MLFLRMLTQRTLLRMNKKPAALRLRPFTILDNNSCKTCVTLKLPSSHITKPFSTCHQEQRTNNIQSRVNDLPEHKQTICALASGSGACGVAVIRISGPNASTLCTMLLPRQKLPPPRYAAFSKIQHPIHHTLIDTGLVLWFPAPHSFTGEDVLELQVHGSPAIIKCLLEALIATQLARLSVAGEFTKRAFYNNKMDLAEVEGLSDLLVAETDMQRVQALALSRGKQSRQLYTWIDQLTDCISSLDGNIEFGDTDDVPLDLARIDGNLRELQQAMQRAIAMSAKGMTIRSGVNIALYGATNVGKSSLLNALTAEERAIVSEMPNTTRDLIPVRMDLGGYAVNLVDTAGFYDDPAHRVESEAMRKSVEVLFDRNTVLHILVIGVDLLLDYRRKCAGENVVDIVRKYVEGMHVSGLLTPENHSSWRTMFAKNTLVAVTKTDLPFANGEEQRFIEELIAMDCTVATSAHTDYGVNALIDACINNIKQTYVDFNPDDVHFTTLRATEALKHAAACIDMSIADAISIDVKSQCLRVAVGSLQSITGRGCPQDVLDDVFENFCIV